MNYNKQVFNSVVLTPLKEAAQATAKAAAKKAAKEAAAEAAKRAAKLTAKKTAKELSTVALKKAGKEGLGKAGRKVVVNETAEVIFKEGGGLITQEMAQKMARKEVTQVFLKQSLSNGAQAFGRTLTKSGKFVFKKGGRYAVIAGVGWMFFKFSNGAVGALGEVLGDAGADTVQATAEWMGNNPIIAAAGTGLVLFVIGGMVLSALAPAAAGKVAKDKVTGGDKESTPSEDSSNEGGE